MRVTINSKPGNMGDESGTLAIEQYEPGRYYIGRWTGETWGPAGAHDITLEQLKSLPNLGYGQTIWLPNMSNPVYRFTGDRQGLDFCENSARAPGTLYFDVEELKQAIDQLVAP